MCKVKSSTNADKLQNHPLHKSVACCKVVQQWLPGSSPLNFNHMWGIYLMLCVCYCTERCSLWTISMVLWIPFTMERNWIQIRWWKSDRKTVNPKNECSMAMYIQCRMEGNSLACDPCSWTGRPGPATHHWRQPALPGWGGRSHTSHTLCWPLRSSTECSLIPLTVACERWTVHQHTMTVRLMNNVWEMNRLYIVCVKDVNS